MTEWLKVVDCKSIRIFLRRFESYFFQKQKKRFLLNKNRLVYLFRGCFNTIVVLIMLLVTFEGCSFFLRY